MNMMRKYSVASTAQAHFLPTMGSSVACWEKAISKQNGISKITITELASFAALLHEDNDSDSYLTSPIYYAFTGRYGLWIYSEGNSFIPFCWHPNVAGQILIFPTRGVANTDILTNLLTKLPQPPVGMRLARVKVNAAVETVRKHLLETSNHTINLTPIVEQVLDWKFPVRILSTSKVAAMKGHDFKQVRNHVRQIDKRNVQIENITSEHTQSILAFVNRWARQASPRSEDIADYIAPYERLLTFVEIKELNMYGFVVIINNEIQACTIWDISNTGSTRTANRFVNICNVDYRGLADYVMHQTAIRRLSTGIDYMNIGGSELASLDSFKNKFVPIQSINLCSADIISDNDHLQVADPENFSSLQEANHVRNQ